MSLIRHRYNRQQTRNAFRAVNRYANAGTGKYLTKRAMGATASLVGGVMTAAKKLPNGRKKINKKKSSIHQSAKYNIGGHGGSYSNFYYTARRLPKAFYLLKNQLSKNYYTWNGSSRSSGTPGIQTITNTQTLFGYTDLNTISQDYNANQTNKLCYMSVSSELLMTNQDAGNVNVVIYDIIARRDLSTQSNLSTPLAAWSNSYSNEGASNGNYTTLGCTPFSSDLFTQYFRVVKMTHITLAQGECHTHRIKFQPNAVIDGELINYNTNGLKGITCFQMMIQYGMPYNDATTKTSVSSGATNIDFIVKKQYKYTWIQDNDTNYYQSNNLSTSFAVNEDIMNEATGTATTETNA